MTNFLTNDTKAIILLCGILGKDRSAEPLTQSEYNNLARWLVREQLRPEALLSMADLDDAAAGAKINRERLGKLLGRGVQLGFAIEEWQRNGLWVISRSDPEYPARYKGHLKDKAPALLFGAGDKSLLQGGGLAMVGSRDVDREGEEFTRQVAETCARNRMLVVSGGARGVDQISMRTTLESGGRTIGVLAENLLKASIERHARHAIAEGQLLLISPYHPQARFTVGTAMGRNKLIYAMADYGLVVSADYKKGGTWAGAEEELKRDKPLAVFVRTHGQIPTGNRKLLDLGALEWPATMQQDDLSQQLAVLADKQPESQTAVRETETLNLFDHQPQQVTEVREDQPKISTSSNTPTVAVEFEQIEPDLPVAVYAAVLPVILHHLQKPMTVDDLAVQLDVTKGQLNLWLKTAVEDGAVKKHNKPVRYSAKKEK
ncbi:MAG: DNA-processing protein DprA [Desulfuromonadales bacterium]|nr:DNA-processing protein DprA [Desulfuromonadales bacterium]